MGGPSGIHKSTPSPNPSPQGGGAREIGPSPLSPLTSSTPTPQSPPYLLLLPLPPDPPDPPLTPPDLPRARSPLISAPRPPSSRPALPSCLPRCKSVPTATDRATARRAAAIPPPAQNLSPRPAPALLSSRLAATGGSIRTVAVEGSGGRGVVPVRVESVSGGAGSPVKPLETRGEAAWGTSRGLQGHPPGWPDRRAGKGSVPPAVSHPAASRCGRGCSPSHAP